MSHGLKVVTCGQIIEQISDTVQCLQCHSKSQLNSFQHSSRENGPKRARDRNRRKILPIHRFVCLIEGKLPQKERKCHYIADIVNIVRLQTIIITKFVH